MKSRPADPRLARLSAVACEHPLATGTIAGTVVLSMLAAGTRSQAANPELGLLSWVALLSVPYAITVTLTIHRLMHVPPSEAVAVAIGAAIVPAAFGFVAVMSGGPAWILLLGAATSMTLVVVALARGRASLP